MRRASLLFFLSSFLLAIGCTTPPADPLFDSATPEVLARGKSLTQGLAACGFCHGASQQPGANLTGGLVFYDRYGAVTASNLTPVEGALSDWTADDIQNALRTNLTPSGVELSQELHRGYFWMSDRDLVAISLYVHSLPPAGEAIPNRIVGFFDRDISGFFDSRHQVKGYVPTITKAFGKAYGRYLVDNVAHCSGCHTQAGQEFKSKNYLAGGQSIRIGDEDKIAPNIRNATDGGGIDKWSERDVVNYLKSGTTPGGRKIDPRFCPVRFYARADDSDLASIASFLKALK